MLSVSAIVANPNQPRRTFDSEALNDLAQSIRQRGVIQPVVVRPVEGGDHHEIVAGERRWRAAQIAGISEIPAVLLDLDDSEVLEIALIENIQRADLNPLEEAAAYRQLMDRFGHTQEQLAEALSKSRSHIANLLRLLTLPAEVQDLIQQGAISMGHARALVTADDPVALARTIVDQGLTVREVEAVRQSDRGKRPPSSGQQRARAEKSPETARMESDLSDGLGLSVSIARKSGMARGRMTIDFESEGALEFLYHHLAAAGRAPKD